MVRTAALLINFLVSVGSAGFALSALVRPATLSGSRDVSMGERFYARMYAARAIPFAFASGILPFFSGGTAVLWILLIAALIQFLDLLIGHRRGDRKMMLGAGIGTAVHLACFLALL